MTTDLSYPDRLPLELEPVGAVQFKGKECQRKPYTHHPAYQETDCLRVLTVDYSSQGWVFCPWCGRRIVEAAQ